MTPQSKRSFTRQNILAVCIPLLFIFFGIIPLYRHLSDKTSLVQAIVASVYILLLALILGWNNPYATTHPKWDAETSRWKKPYWVSFVVYVLAIIPAIGFYFEPLWLQFIFVILSLGGVLSMRLISNHAMPQN